jgi:hypothetical protein
MPATAPALKSYSTRHHLMKMGVGGGMKSGRSQRILIGTAVGG